MVKIFTTPFAHAGTKQVIPDKSDPQGFVSNEDGFTTDYELPDTDPNYKPIERAEFNGLMNMVTESLGEIQQFGFAKWQPMTWPQGARVVKGGVVYRALVQTSQQPPHANWANESAVNLTGNQTIEGVKTFSSFPVTPSAVPTANYQVANKKYVDNGLIPVVNATSDPTPNTIMRRGVAGRVQAGDPVYDKDVVNKRYLDNRLIPGIVGSITLNGTTNNTVVMTDIVTRLGLDVGDVIRIKTGAYNKLHTVESITDNSSIIVNYEHAGNRANGQLRLPDFTGGATVLLAPKWYNAPIGMGQAWQNLAASRALDTTYTNTTGRAILVNISTRLADGDGMAAISLTVGGVLVARSVSRYVNHEKVSFVSALVPAGATYAAALNTGGLSGSLYIWAELR